MPKYIFDLETRSAADIREGLDSYFACPYFRVLTWVMKNLETGVLITHKTGSLEAVIKNPAITFVAHNATFEWYALNTLARANNWPPVAFERFECTMATAATLGLVQGLESLAILFDLPVRKDALGKKLIKLYSVPQRYGGFNDFLPEAEALMLSYNISDVLTTEALYKALPKMTPYQRAVWQLTHRINHNGLGIDTALVDLVTPWIEDCVTQAGIDVIRLSDGAVDSCRAPAQTLRWLRTQGVHLENTEEATILAAIPTATEKVKAFLKAKYSGSRTAYDKFRFASKAVFRGRLRNSLWYHGAFTGRWTGEGLQPQNIVKGKMKDWSTDSLADYLQLHQSLPPGVEVPEAVTQLARGIVAPTLGSQFYICDYAAIEARVLAWISGQTEALQVYYDKGDPYKVMAKAIFGTPIDEVNPMERFIGKTAVLGAGYGLGGVMFAKKVNEDALKFGIAMSSPLGEEEGHAILKLYRKTNYKVPMLWRALENAFRECILSGKKQVVCDGRIAYRKGSNGVSCELPSGRKIYYANARLNSDGVITYQKKKYKAMLYVDTWGGKLTQGICQAIAADVMAEGMLRVEPLIGSIVLTVHDEVVAEVPLGPVDREPLDLAMMTVGPWAAGLPLAVESSLKPRYQK